MNEDQARELAVELAMNSDGAPVEIIVPIAFFLAIVVPICLHLYFRYRSRREVQQTIRAAIEQGQQLTPELLERIGQPQSDAVRNPTRRDLRRGVIVTAIGVGLAVFGLVDGDRDLVAIAGLPLLIGLAFLLLWYLDSRQAPMAQPGSDPRRADDRER